MFTIIFLKCFLLRSDETEPEIIAIDMTERLVKEEVTLIINLISTPVDC